MQIPITLMSLEALHELRAEHGKINCLLSACSTLFLCLALLDVSE